MTYYVTTAIPYVNAEPHLGHCLEYVQTDVLARHHRLRGQDVRFLSGTDDHAMKNVTAAREAGEDVAAFVAHNGQRYADLGDLLELSWDDFIHTSSDPRHRPAVEKAWTLCAERGDFYQKSYTGLYCTGCEQFYTPDELVDGLCREHNRPPEHVTENNWFFRLTRYTDRIREVITSGEVEIQPVQKRNEVLAFIDSGLQDFSVSRPMARAAGWGIPVPGDRDQVIYVWWDALVNYISALDYGTDGDAFRTWWTEGDERVHVIGKGITRFHAVYWLALLLSAGEELPSRIIVHDYVNLGGAKLSKSVGNALGPKGVVADYGVDALRWWYCREVPLLGDAEFTVERMTTAYTNDLANGVGNLVNRTLALSHKYLDGTLTIPTDGPLLALARALPGQVDAALAESDFRGATAAICHVSEQANRVFAAVKPWALGKDDKRDELSLFLGEVIAVCRIVAQELAPFIPGGAARTARQLGQGADVPTPTPAFPRLDLSESGS